jgi:hypothetical protein
MNPATNRQWKNARGKSALMMPVVKCWFHAVTNSAGSAERSSDFTELALSRSGSATSSQKLFPA